MQWSATPHTGISSINPAEARVIRESESETLRRTRRVERSAHQNRPEAAGASISRPGEAVERREGSKPEVSRKHIGNDVGFSTSTPMPISAAPSDPTSSDRAPESRNTPRAEIASSQKETRGAKKRSSSHPVPIRPSRLAAPMIDTANAPPLVDTPRSVSSAAKCVMAPFWLMELRTTATITQKARERRPS